MPVSDSIRRYRRFQGWDYSKGASLFITIATAPRRRLFGEIRGGEVELSPLGEKVKESLESIPRLNPGILLYGHVVMPDHVHFNCGIAPGLHEPLKVLGGAVRRFKNYTTALAKRSLAINSGPLGMRPTVQSPGRLLGVCGLAGGGAPAPRNDGRGCGGIAIPADHNLAGGGVLAPRNDGRTAFGQSPGQLWQQGYHDYLLLSRAMIDATERYIAYNPLKWELMYGAGGGLRVQEPIFSPRLDARDYWKAVGNIALLSPDEKLLSLRVSRKIASPSAIEGLLRRIASAVDQGYVIVSGFISKGEKAVRDMLCQRPDARFIRILPSCIPNRRFRPESIYAEAFADNRYLEIAQGNDETEFGRAACLDLNAEIIEIATACSGLAIYWQPDGPHVLANGTG